MTQLWSLIYYRLYQFNYKYLTVAVVTTQPCLCLVYLLSQYTWHSHSSHLLSLFSCSALIKLWVTTLTSLVLQITQSCSHQAPEVQQDLDMTLSGKIYQGNMFFKICRLTDCIGIDGKLVLRGKHSASITSHELLLYMGTSSVSVMYCMNRWVNGLLAKTKRKPWSTRGRPGKQTWSDDDQQDHPKLS